MARKKSQPSWWIAVALLILGLFSFLGKMQTGQSTVDQPPGPTAPDSPSPFPPLPPASSADKLKIASFNIQVFGISKLENRPVIEKLAEVIRQFDLVAIQEIRALDQTFLPEFMKLVNSRGVTYQHLIGPRLGRTSSKEQYAYLFRSDRLELIPNSAFTAQDPEDLLHREPHIASFRSRTTKGNPFTFTLINAHTDPDEAEFEVTQLAQVYQFVTHFHRQEDDIILLGDLNVDNRKLTPLTRIPQLTSVVPEGPTNTRRTQQYDHIVVNRLNTTEFTGRAGVFDLQQHFQISQEQALELSDHLPVWAEFSTMEHPHATQLASPGSDTIVR